MAKGPGFNVALGVAIGLLGFQIQCGGGGGGGSPAAAAPAAPSIASFVANASTITAGGTAHLTGVFANGTGVITPGNIPATSGTAVSVSPSTTTSYTLTVTSATGSAVTQDAGVTVVPTGAAVITPRSVQASGVQQTTSGGTFSNGPVVGEPLPATTTSSPSNSFQVRNDFLPPVPN